MPRFTKMEFPGLYKEFIQDDLPQIQAALKEERWIWESDESDQ